MLLLCKLSLITPVASAPACMQFSVVNRSMHLPPQESVLSHRTCHFPLTHAPAAPTSALACSGCSHMFIVPKALNGESQAQQTSVSVALKAHPPFPLKTYKTQRELNTAPAQSHTSCALSIPHQHHRVTKEEGMPKQSHPFDEASRQHTT